MLSVLIPKAGLTGLDSSGICSDPDVVQDYDTDPLVYHGKTSARLAAEMLKAIDCVRLNAAKISLPVLIMHGGSDEVVNPDASDYLHEKISSTDKKKVIFEGFRHEIFNEPDHIKALDKTLEFIDIHL